MKKRSPEHKVTDSTMKLVAVEYDPPDKNVRVGGKRRAIDLPVLAGCVGETFEEWLSDKNDREFVPVRFPLTVPGGRAEFNLKQGDPLDPTKLEEQSVELDKKGLHRLERKPISLYEPMKEAGNFDDLFESPSFMKVDRRQDFIKLLGKAAEHYSLCWYWKKEIGDPAPAPTLFIEGRIYGIDSVISTYDKKNFGGIAVEVIHRPWPSKKQWQEGLLCRRKSSETFVMSNSEEYISYIDGVSLPMGQTDRLTPKKFVDKISVGPKVGIEFMKKIKDYDGDASFEAINSILRKMELRPKAARARKKVVLDEIE